MKVTRFGEIRHRTRMPAGLLLMVAVGSLEAWTFWRLAINLSRAFKEHERAARLPVSIFPKTGSTN